jgi:hypothetical protein
VLLLGTVTLISCNITSQTKYNVLSVDSVKSIKHYIIKVKEGEKQLTILSAYSQKQPTENSVIISQGTELNIILKKIDEKNNPYTPLFKNVRGNGGLYIDGKLIYDPNVPLYSSECISGLSYLTDCKKH